MARVISAPAFGCILQSVDVMFECLNMTVPELPLMSMLVTLMLVRFSLCPLIEQLSEAAIVHPPLEGGVHGPFSALPTLWNVEGENWLLYSVLPSRLTACPSKCGLRRLCR